MFTVEQLFPKDSQIARWMFNVLILRSDLIFELRLIGARDELIHRMNSSKNGAAEFHARTYFFRGTLRSMYSAKKVVDYLMTIKEFRDTLESSSDYAEFKELNKTVAKAAKEFRDLRNQMGGHVEEHIASARDLMDDATIIALERDDQVGWSPRMGLQALYALTCGRDETDEDMPRRFEGRLERMQAAGLATFKLLDLIANQYLRPFAK